MRGLWPLIMQCIKSYFRSPRAFTTFSYVFLSFDSRYLRWVRRSATIWSNPRRECLSRVCFLRCPVNASICFERSATCAEAEPVSSAWSATGLIAFTFCRFVSMTQGIYHIPLENASTPLSRPIRPLPTQNKSEYEEYDQLVPCLDSKTSKFNLSFVIIPHC